MLDQTTKRHIDTARDILVGKIPDPKSQVEQITIAMIYKFMDDRDQESILLGGKATFFTGEYAMYAWSKLLDSRLSGPERLKLYMEGITRMATNPHIPQLFRDIFKGAFLPYQDPRTLTLFLKQINAFTYEHSENLGNAFEYLLSVLGSQGQAGQFRTPRHIIDFIVKVVDPQKNEKILDPACGTAGFLISAYKHILTQNTSDTEDNKISKVTEPLLGDLLTQKDYERFAKNFAGYDMSPDMVRLSLANMYLHGFVNPQIYEYDTLSSQTRWHEQFDVILANPPFMTPKGGIIPHSAFHIQSKKAEVLFVDYIMEHLRINGRAGIIVPEGIIFQTSKAYQALRKLLVENGLYAVVSLPSGVFQPYSGVKTSILLIDKALVKKSDDFLFVQVNYDGFDLGAKRRVVKQDDLPMAFADIQRFRAAVMEGKDLNKEDSYHLSHVVAKSKIAANADYNLIGNRYKLEVDYSCKKWPMVALGEVCEIAGEYGSNTKKVNYNGNVRYIRISDIKEDGNVKNKKVSPEKIEPRYFLEKNDILIARSGSVGLTYIHKESIENNQFASYLLRFRVKTDVLHPYFCYYLTKGEHWKNFILLQSKTGTLTNINAKQYCTFKIPLPPLSVQEEMVKETESYQKIIDGAKQVVEHWAPSIEIDPAWPMVALEEVCEVKNGLWKGKKEPFKTVKIIRNTNFGKNGVLNLTNIAKYPVEMRQLENRQLKYGDIILENSGGGPKQPVGRVVFFGITSDDIYSWSNFTARIRLKSPALDPKYFFYVLHDLYQKGWTTNIQSRTSGIRNLDKKAYKQTPIPLPPLAVQKEIVAKIEAEEHLIKSARELIAVYEEKKKAVIAKVWEDK